MGNDFAGRFFEWQNYVHYLINALLILIEINFLPSINATSEFTFTNILIIALLILINDTLIHAMFWFAPKPFQWRD